MLATQQDFSFCVEKNLLGVRDLRFILVIIFYSIAFLGLVAQQGQGVHVPCGQNSQMDTMSSLDRERVHVQGATGQCTCPQDDLPQ